MTTVHRYNTYHTIKEARKEAAKLRSIGDKGVSIKVEKRKGKPTNYILSYRR